MKTCTCGQPSLSGRKLCRDCFNRNKRERYATDADYRQKCIQTVQKRYDPDYAKGRYEDLKQLAFQVLGGGPCGGCGFADTRALQLDHINNDGYRKRKEENEWGATLYRKVIATKGAGFQILCANCNLIKKVEAGLTGGRQRLPKP